MKKSWLQKGSEFTLVEGEFDVISKIKPGIYNITKDLQGWHLEKFQEKFEFPHKIYGLHTNFIKYILKTYHNTTGNLGVLMNGVKGSGKTVCSKILANELELPVIIVKSWGSENSSLIEYLGSFNFDCVLFFDEFEKQFENNDNTILQIMDGVYNDKDSRRVFILTTNDLNINENLISRPSRIRYIKSFENLDLDTAKEYLNDNLNNKEEIEDVLNFLETLENSTIDVLKSIVAEINIHGFKEFDKVKSWFNITTVRFNYKCLESIVDKDDVEEILEQTGETSLIPLFEKDLESRKNPPRMPQEMEGWDLLSEKEQDEAIMKYKHDIQPILSKIKPCSFETEIRFNKIKIGDYIHFRRTGRVVSISYDKNILVYEDDYVDDLHILKILNPDNSPKRLNSDSSKKSTLINYEYCSF